MSNMFDLFVVELRQKLMPMTKCRKKKEKIIRNWESIFTFIFNFVFSSFRFEQNIFFSFIDNSPYLASKLILYKVLVCSTPRLSLKGYFKAKKNERRKKTFQDFLINHITAFLSFQLQEIKNFHFITF